MTPLNVLIVEDEPAIRRSLEQWLSRQGCIVFWSSTGESAIKQLELNRIDVILLDLHLGHGKMTGWDVARFRHGHPRYRDIPLVVITGVPEEEVHSQAQMNILGPHYKVFEKGRFDLEDLGVFLRSIKDTVPEPKI